MAFGLTVLLATLAMEGILRARGSRPQPRDSVDLWAVHMVEALDDGDTERTIVVAGASRAQLGFDPAVLEERLASAGYEGWRVVLLAANGRNPQPLLAYLAERGFKGTVLCSFDAEWVQGDDVGGMQAWIDHYDAHYYRGCPVDRVLNLRARMFLQEHLAFVRPRSERDLQVWLDSDPVPLELQPSRHIKADYQKHFTPEGLADYAKRQERVAHRDNAWARERLELWDDGLRTLVDDVARLRDVGANLVLIRFPTAGVFWELHDELMPRARYWDRMVAELGVRSLHFQDLGGLEGLELPDGGAHLDRQSAEVWTRRLFEALHEREWIRGGAR